MKPRSSSFRFAREPSLRKQICSKEWNFVKSAVEKKSTIPIRLHFLAETTLVTQVLATI